MTRSESPTDSFDYAAAAARLLDIARKRSIRNAGLFDQATQDCRGIIGMIRSIYRPSRIYQWGSLLDRRRFDENSDIDIGVEGLAAPEQIFALCTAAERMTKFPLHIIELEKIHPVYAESIRRRGKLVYERPK